MKCESIVGMTSSKIQSFIKIFVIPFLCLTKNFFIRAGYIDKK